MSLTEKSNSFNNGQTCGCVPNLRCSKCSNRLCIHQFRAHICSTKIARNRPL